MYGVHSSLLLEKRFSNLVPQRMCIDFLFSHEVPGNHSIKLEYNSLTMGRDKPIIWHPVRFYTQCIQK